MIRTWWLLAAAGAPILISAAVLAREAMPGAWLTLAPGTLAVLTADVLLLNAAAIVLGAPLAGVALASSAQRLEAPVLQPTMSGALRQTGLTITPLIAAVAVFVAVSGALVWIGLGMTADALRNVAMTHAVLAAAGVALGALGGLCGWGFRDPLDAGACSAACSLAAATGVLVAGPLVSEAPTSIVNAALLASPIVATASAGHIDILRTEVLYQLSPIAHTRFEYPRWYFAVTLYLVFTIACLAGALVSARLRRLRIDA